MGAGGYADLATTAGAPPGSGKNFAALKGKLAARGASNPGALAAYIGRRKYGKAGFARLSAHGRSSSHAWPSYGGITLAGSEFEGTRLTCPSCGHSGSASSFGAGGASLEKSPSELRTPARGDHAGRAGFSPGSSGIQVRTGPGGAGLANRRGQAVELSGRRLPVTGPSDVIVSRGADGRAVIRHRQGAAEIAQIRRNEDGTWTAAVGGRDLPSRNHQRTALMDAVGTYNSAVTTPVRAGLPLQGPPQQTELMRQYGIPAIRALAVPAVSAGGGGRVTLASQGGGDDGDTDDDGLSPRGQAIRDRLKKKGMAHDRATLFAKRSQSTRPGQFGQAAS